MTGQRRRRRLSERYFEFDDRASLDAVVLKAADAIRELWDGTADSVAIIARVTQTQARIAFMGRYEAIRQLRLASAGRPDDSASFLTRISSRLEDGTRGGVSCLVLGFGSPALLELDLDNLQCDEVRPDDIPVGEHELNALQKLEVLRHVAKFAVGRRIPELDALANVLLYEADSVWAVSHAIRRAYVATCGMGDGELREQARRLLDELEQETASRCGDRINAPGGLG